MNRDNRRDESYAQAEGLEQEHIDVINVSRASGRVGSRSVGGADAVTDNAVGAEGIYAGHVTAASARPRTSRAAPRPGAGNPSGGFANSQGGGPRGQRTKTAPRSSEAFEGGMDRRPESLDGIDAVPLRNGRAAGPRRNPDGPRRSETGNSSGSFVNSESGRPRRPRTANPPRRTEGSGRDTAGRPEAGPAPRRTEGSGRDTAGRPEAGAAPRRTEGSGRDTA